MFGPLINSDMKVKITRYSTAYKSMLCIFLHFSYAYYLVLMLNIYLFKELTII